MMLRRLLSGLVVVAAAATVAVGTAGPANALFGMPDALPAGSLACTDWVQSSRGAFINGYADYNTATFTTRMSTTVGGPETTIFSKAVKGYLQIVVPGLDYPVENILVTPPAGAGTVFLRNCVEATGGPQYRFGLRITGNDRAGLADVGPHQARLGPGGSHCGDFVAGPADGTSEGVARLVGSASVPVKFSIRAKNEDYATIGTVHSVTGTAVDEVFVATPNISELNACVQNTSTTTVTVSFELSPV